MRDAGDKREFVAVLEAGQWFGLKEGPTMEPKKFMPKDPAVFPAGTRWFAVGDTPVSWVPRMGGGVVSFAWDVMPPRAFSAAEVFRKGRLIDQNEFEVVWAAMNFDRLSDPEQCEAVRRFLALPQVKREAMSVRIRGPILAQAMVMSLRAQTRLEGEREARLEAMAECLADEAIRRAQLRARRGSFT